MDEIKSRMVLEDHTYMVNGRPLVLYRIGVLASMLGRESVTMRKLERLGYIPKTPYTLKHEKRLGAIRLYSEEMILGLVNLAREEKILIQYGIPIYKTRFRERAKELFDQLLINQSGDVDLTGQAA
ncbi:hypothetical protein FDA94_29100 [Herbidospora galbida]|uniref:MerR family transcriptional regulator n=1 Tax=Herbidospora galbida TaxID=2575442 RepID=A0A4V5UYF7_9ACTN|nr:hypothetical protein [Herbidospora galbida]TKK84673.1 hypothetical protein FDA94_29100 [Herbidospora galbida]